MARYLLAPSFKFMQNLINLIPVNSEFREGGRVLIYPIEDGVRLRTMCHTRVVTATVGGSKVDIEFTVEGKQVKTIMGDVVEVDTLADEIFEFLDQE